MKMKHLRKAREKFGPMPKSIPDQIDYIRKCHEYVESKK